MEWLTSIAETAKEALKDASDAAAAAESSSKDTFELPIPGINEEDVYDEGVDDDAELYSEEEENFIVDENVENNIFEKEIKHKEDREGMRRLLIDMLTMCQNSLVLIDREELSDKEETTDSESLSDEKKIQSQDEKNQKQSRSPHKWKEEKSDEEILFEIQKYVASLRDSRLHTQGVISKWKQKENNLRETETLLDELNESSTKSNRLGADVSDDSIYNQVIKKLENEIRKCDHEKKIFKQTLQKVEDDNNKKDKRISELMQAIENDQVKMNLAKNVHEENISTLRRQSEANYATLNNQFVALGMQCNAMIVREREMKAAIDCMQKEREQILQNHHQMMVALNTAHQRIRELETDFELARKDVGLLAEEKNLLQKQNTELRTQNISKFSQDVVDNSDTSSESTSSKELYLKLLEESSQMMELLRRESKERANLEKEVLIARQEVNSSKSDVALLLNEHQINSARLIESQQKLIQLKKEINTLTSDYAMRIKETEEQSRSEIERVSSTNALQIQILLEKIKALESEKEEQLIKIKQLEEAIEISLQEIESFQKKEEIQQNVSNSVDRILAKQLIVTYFTKAREGSKQAQTDVMEMISKILDFSPEERFVVGLESKGNPGSSQGVIDVGLGFLMGNQGLELAKKNAKQSFKIVEEKSFEDLFVQFVAGEM